MGNSMSTCTACDNCERSVGDCQSENGGERRARVRPKDVRAFSEQIKQSECKCPAGPKRFAAVTSQRNTDFAFCPTCNRPTSSLGERQRTLRAHRATASSVLTIVRTRRPDNNGNK